jgi:signal peptidase I
MGDNRDASFDSRRFGAIPLDDLVGEAFVTIWPISHIGGF